MILTYEVSSANGVYIYKDEQEIPMIFQPNWPNGSPFSSVKEAESWAEYYIESTQNPNSEFMAGLSPEEHPRKRPESQEEFI